MPACVVNIRHVGIVFNLSLGAITDYSQSANNTNPYLSLNSVEDHGQRKPVLILLNEPSKPGARVHDRNTLL